MPDAVCKKDVTEAPCSCSRPHGCSRATPHRFKLHSKVPTSPHLSPPVGLNPTPPDHAFTCWQEEQAFHMAPRREHRSSLSAAESQSISANIDLIAKLRRQLEERDAEIVSLKVWQHYDFTSVTFDFTSRPNPFVNVALRFGPEG